MFNECRHVMPSGARCKAPALKHRSFCYFHWRLRSAGSTKRSAKKPLRLPSLEDPHGIQIALMQILGALGSPSLDSKRAGLYLYGLQIATQLTARVSAPRDVVRSLSYDAQSGEILAPETVQCEPGTECDACATRDECVLPARVAHVAARQFYAQAMKDLRHREQREFEAVKESPLAALIDRLKNEPEWEDPPAPDES